MRTRWDMEGFTIISTNTVGQSRPCTSCYPPVASSRPCPPPMIPSVLKAGTLRRARASTPGGRGILVLVLPPVWNLRAFSLIPLLLPSLVVLPSPIAFSAILFLLLTHSPALYFPKSCLFER